MVRVLGKGGKERLVPFNQLGERRRIRGVAEGPRGRSCSACDRRGGAALAEPRSRAARAARAARTAAVAIASRCS